jgi:DNA-binding CsgD family transcriptional regulator
MVDGAMRRRIAEFVPHAHRALRINRAIDAKQSEAASFSDALNGLSAAVFLIDAHCRLIHANTAGNDLLTADDILRLIGGRLTIRNPQQQQALRKRFAASGDVPIRIDEISLPLTANDGERHILRILPVNSVTRAEPGATGKAVAALFVQKTEIDIRSCAGLIAATFHLTPAESRVLLAIVQTGGVPETATRLRVAETTVKTHLHRIFAKTGASRQTDLIRLTAGYASPLAS